MAGNRYRGRKSQYLSDLFSQLFDTTLWLLANSRVALRARGRTVVVSGLIYATWLGVQRSPYFLIGHVSMGDSQSFD